MNMCPYTKMPCQKHGHNHHADMNFTLRDRFALAWLANRADSLQTGEAALKQSARRAYQAADAFLAVRNCE